MKTHQKIILGCAAAGLLLTSFFVGCDKRGGDVELRRDVYNLLSSRSDKTYSILQSEKDYTITAKIKKTFDLEVTITNNATSDQLKLIDKDVIRRPYTYYLDGLDPNYRRGVDEARYNGVKGNLNGADEEFDKALEVLKLQLDEEINKEEYKVRQNIKLE